jgi:hypothetical protein
MIQKLFCHAVEIATSFAAGGKKKNGTAGRRMRLGRGNRFDNVFIYFLFNEDLMICSRSKKN